MRLLGTARGDAAPLVHACQSALPLSLLFTQEDLPVHPPTPPPADVQLLITLPADRERAGEICAH